MALIASERGWGLFNLLGFPAWAAILTGLIALDFVIYIQHVVMHHVPVLWRLHRMHHADLDIDVTTGVRFHPIEILFSMAIKIAAVAALGVPAVAVLIFEVVLNATSMFNHSNVALPPRLDAIARWIVVTPQMHQVHHSTERVETDSNFGFNLPWWDRLFGTYRAEPAAGEQNIVIGLPIFRGSSERSLIRLLTQPFRRGGTE
ncbi:MAG: sterol desaturase family protein [Pseudolabrys sp.]